MFLRCSGKFAPLCNYKAAENVSQLGKNSKRTNKETFKGNILIALQYNGAQPITMLSIVHPEEIMKCCMQTLVLFLHHSRAIPQKIYEEERPSFQTTI